MSRNDTMKLVQFWGSGRRRERQEGEREVALAIDPTNDAPTESIGLFPLEPVGVDMGAALPLLESVIPIPIIPLASR
jgi:hypothetical protein